MQVLITGLGSIARKHITALRKLQPDVRIQALRSSAGSDADPGVESIHAWEEVVQPDFILISNPTAFHRDTIERALAYRCPLLIEKPIFHKLGAAETAALAQIRISGVPTYVACNLRFHPVVLFLKNRLENNALRVQEVSAYCGSYLPAWRPGTDFRAGYSADPGMGGGVHLDLIHELDYLNFIWGLPAGVQSLVKNRSALSIAAADSARYLLDYGHFSASVTLNYFRRDAKRTVEIVLEDDTLTGDLIQCTVTRHSDGAEVFKATDFTMADTYVAQLDYFIRHRHTKMMNDADEAAGVLKIALT